MITYAGPWHGWFAWCPVWSPDGGWLWLRRIERRFLQWRFDGPMSTDWSWSARYRRPAA